MSISVPGRMSVASERAESSGSPRSPQGWSPSCAPGSLNVPASRNSPCSPPTPANPSAVMLLSIASPNMWRSPAPICPTLRQKTVTMHVLRHTAAMRLLRAGIDTSVIALWLGHEQIETTQIYLHADLAHQGARPGKNKSDRTPRPAAIGRPTSCSPFWRRSDYAAPNAAITAPEAGSGRWSA